MAKPIENAFIGRTTQPSEADVTRTLGRAKPVWDQLLAELTSQHAVDGREWRSYSPKAGWSLRLQRRGRTILWLAPSAGCFVAIVILGDRAVADALRVGLPAKARELLDEAPRYAEGTGVRLPVKSVRDLSPVRTLVAIKVRN